MASRSSVAADVELASAAPTHAAAPIRLPNVPRDSILFVPLHDKDQHRQDRQIKRKAACWPFHCGDCHIWNRSPPITMKPKNQTIKPRPAATAANPLARLKLAAGERKWRSSNAAAPAKPSAVAPSPAMIRV